jgi:hypothetical protein
MFAPVIRWFAAMLSACAIAAVFAQEDAPLPDPDEGLEIEPPLLIQSRDRDGLPVVPSPTPRADIAKLEKELTRARKGAESADRLYKAGIIAKVEAEERVLRVVRLEARLAAARLEEAKEKSVEQAAEEVAQAEQTAKRTAEERHRAEIEAALRNLQRQQKLLALGSARKADVARAEKRLAELQDAAAASDLK